MVPMHARLLKTREPKIWLFSSAFNAWLACIAAGLLLVVSRQNLFPPSNDPAETQLLDALSLASVAVLTGMMFRRGSPESLTYLQALSIGAFWVALSLLSVQAYRAAMEDRHALRFLLTTMMGDSNPGGGWTWNLFLIVQLTALPVTKFLREGFLRFRATRVVRQY